MKRRAFLVLAVAAMALGCDPSHELAPTGPDLSRVVLPPAPMDLAAAAVSSTRIDVTWDSRGTDAGEIRIERSVGTSDAFVQIATTAIANSTYSDLGLEAGTTYWYRVRACIAAGCSGYSNEASATTPSGGLTWTIETLPRPMSRISGVSATSVFAAGGWAGPDALYFDGATWTNITEGDPLWFETMGMAGIWAHADDDLYGVIFCGQVARFDGAAWSLIGPPFQESVAMRAPFRGSLLDPIKPMCWFYWAIWGASGADIYLVGEFGQAARYDGTSWSGISPGPFNVFTDELLDVWGASGTDVFVVGGDLWGNQRGTILRYDGATWTTMISSKRTTVPVLDAVWGSSAANVFAVGREGTILRFDGVNWTAMDSGTGAHLTGVWGTSADNVYAVGSAGTLLHFDGASWSSIDYGTTAGLSKVWVAPTGDVFAVGGNVLVRGTP